MAGRLSIPYLTRAGVVNFKFRLTGPGEPKYLSGGDTRLYNTLAMDEADETGVLGVCEGEMDALVNSGLVGIPSVGIPGVDTYKKHSEWRELLRGYETVLVFKHNDPTQNREQGEYNPGLELAKALRRDVDVARIVQLPCKDVNETFIKFGREVIREASGL